MKLCFVGYEVGAVVVWRRAVYATCGMWGVENNGGV